MDMYEGHGVRVHMQSPNLVISGADGQGGPRHIGGMLGPGTGGTGTHTAWGQTGRPVPPHCNHQVVALEQCRHANLCAQAATGW